VDAFLNTTEAGAFTKQQAASIKKRNNAGSQATGAYFFGVLDRRDVKGPVDLTARDILVSRSSDQIGEP
jgi:hypothetical protein